MKETSVERCLAERNHYTTAVLGNSPQIVSPTDNRNAEPTLFFLFLVSPRLSFSLSLNETIAEIGLPVHYLAQLFILCAHFMLGSDTSVDNALWLCIRKSVCLSLPLDFSRAGPVGHPLFHPTHLVSPHSDPWSLWTACGLAWWTSRGLGERQGWAHSNLCPPHCIRDVGPMSELFLAYSPPLFKCRLPCFIWTSAGHCRPFLFCSLVSNYSFPYALHTARLIFPKNANSIIAYLPVSPTRL